MQHITWLLVVLTLALGCGRDKKAWAQKIDKLVQRAYACQDVPCAKQVNEEMGAIIGSDEEGRNLDEGEPEFMFDSAKRIRNRVEALEGEAADAKLRASAPLTALDVFETTIRACTLAYADLHHAVRPKVEASIAKVGATLPPDQVPQANGPGGLFWHDAFVEAFVTAMDGKVPVADAIYTKAAADLCILNYRYDATLAKNNPEMFGRTIDQLERIMGSFDQGAVVKDLVAAVRRAAPDTEVFELTATATRAIRESLTPKK